MRYLILLATCLLMLCFAGCGGEEPEPQPEIPPPSPGHYQYVFHVAGDRLSQREANTWLAGGARVIAIRDGIVVIEATAKLTYDRE